MPQGDEDVSSYTEDQIHIVADAFQAAGLTPNHLTMLGQNHQLLVSIREVLDGRAEILPIQVQSVLAPPPPVVLGDHNNHRQRVLVGREEAKVVSPTNFIIHVRRSPIERPQWVKKAEHPEMEGSGPASYDVRSLKPLSSYVSMKGSVGTLAGLYSFVLQNGFLPLCFELADLVAFTRNGIKMFREAGYKGKELLAPRSVWCSEFGSWRMPSLSEGGENGFTLRYRAMSDKVEPGFTVLVLLSPPATE